MIIIVRVAIATAAVESLLVAVAIRILVSMMPTTADIAVTTISLEPHTWGSVAVQIGSQLCMSIISLCIDTYMILPFMDPHVATSLHTYIYIDIYAHICIYPCIVSLERETEPVGFTRATD